MLKLLASFLLLLSLNYGIISICHGSFAPAQAPSIPTGAPTSSPPVATGAPTSSPPVPTGAPTVAPMIAPTVPTRAPAIAPPTLAPAAVPVPAPPPRPLPSDEEVEGVNALLALSKMPGSIYSPNFSNEDCQSYDFYPKIWCKCEGDTCKVISILLQGQNLQGRIPEKIGLLTNLETLDLSSNKLSGTIPQAISNLSQLEVLRLSKNKLEGSLKFIAEMKSLRTIGLNDNSFNESIPPGFGNLESLEMLDLSNNLLSGTIPKELGNISSLDALYLRDNNLGGPLPDELGNLTYLYSVDFSNNNLDGSLPSTFKNLTSLRVFQARGNNLDGQIPDFISNWTDLYKLALSGNKISGPPLPTAITGLKFLYHIEITDLALPQEGTEFTIPELKSTEVRWETLILRKCSLTGPIPNFIWNLPTLTYLDLSFNKLFGGIPPNVVGSIRTTLFKRTIFLRKNKLNETLPGWLTNLKDSNVDVSENLFTNVENIPAGDQIPPNLNLFSCCNASYQNSLMWQQPNYDCVDELTTYDHLYINCGGDETSINGSHYEADLGSRGASTFFLSNNSRWAYSSLGTFVDSNQKSYTVNETCNITMADAPLYIDARISPISLNYYGFCLKNGNYTLKLYFAEIGLSQNKAGFKRRRVFDIDIQGGQYYIKDFNIEEEAKGVDKNRSKEFSVTVTNRKLEVHLYWSGKGSTSTRDYGPLISAISLSPPILRGHRKLPPATVGAIAGSTTIFVALLLAIFWKLGWLHKKEEPEFREFEIFPGEKLNFKNIKEATNSFEDGHKIGEGHFGAVYKGILPDKTEIAVKRVSAKSKEGAKKFMNEIVTLYALRHPNLVSLRGACAKDNELLLVHEFMTNGSLRMVLFDPQETTPSLDWERRVRICLDVAKGLEFLHEEKSKRQIIHRDIKPTNILLDKDLNAKISDFGYAEFNAEEITAQRNDIKGTQVYMAPEYVQGRLTAKADVYSFGIVMLEIFSGKEMVSTNRPKGQTEYLWDKAHEYEKEGNLIALLDAKLVRSTHYTYKKALKVLELAMKCVDPAPTLRPSMADVVKDLQEVLGINVEESEDKLKNKSRSDASSSSVDVTSPSAQSGST